MTLLSIAIAVADEVGLPRPTSVIGNTEPDVQKILRYANRAGNELMKKYPWQELRGESTFTSVGTEAQTAILPDDFDRIVPETFWNRTDTVLISGPVGATRWQSYKASSYSNTSTPVFAYRGGAILIQPTMTAGKSLAFEYVQNTWCEGASAQASWAADADVGRIDEELMILAIKYLYLTSEGLPNAAAGGDFNDYFNTLVRNDQPDSNVMVAADIFGGGRHFQGAPTSDSSLF